MAPCPSYLQLARFKTDDLDASSTETIRVHLSACEKCRRLSAGMDSAVAEYEGNRAAHQAALLARLDETPMAKASGRRRPLFAAVAVAAATAAAILIVTAGPFGPSGESADDGIRFKGSFAVKVVASRDGTVFPVREGARLRSGDAVRFSVTVDRPGYLTVFSIDEAGTLSPFYPPVPLEKDAEPTAIDAGQHLLPGSIVLDDATGQERIVTLFSEAKFDRRQAIRESISSLEKGNLSASGSEIWIQSLRVVKEVASGP